MSNLALRKSLQNALDNLRGMSAKKLRRLAEKNSRTTRLQLAERRVLLQEQTEMVTAQINEAFRLMHEVGPNEARDKQIQQSIALANLWGMQGYLQGLGLIVDCLSEVEKCKKRMPDGTLQPALRRYSIAENAIDQHDMQVYMLNLADQQIQLMRHLARSAGMPLDEHGVEDDRLDKSIDREPEAAEETIYESDAAGVVTDTDADRLARELRDQLMGKEAQEREESEEGESAAKEVDAGSRVV